MKILDKEAALRQRFKQLGISEADIEEKFICSSGKGGQNVNKVATCVYLKHHPSGIEVKMQQQRTQASNRYQARVLLADKLEAQISDKARRNEQEREKLRRQKRKRSRRSKERVLQAKKNQSQKKNLRKPPKV